MINVLIVDDDPAARAQVRRLLEPTQACTIVGEAPDGASAIQMAAAVGPDVVVLDLVMPVMDGLEALPHLVRVCPQARVVVFSSIGVDGIDEIVRLRGGHATVGKASPATRLLDAVLGPGLEVTGHDHRPAGERTRR